MEKGPDFMLHHISAELWKSMQRRYAEGLGIWYQASCGGNGCRTSDLGPRQLCFLVVSIRKSKSPPCPAKERRDKGWGLLGVELPGAAEGLGSVDGGNARNGGYHHAREKLHGGYIALVEGSGGGRKDFENPKRTAVVAQGGDQNGADSQAAATGEIDAGIALGVVTEHDLAGTDGFGGDAGIGLEADTKIGSGTARACAANNFVAGAQSDGGPGGTSEMLGAFGDGADRGLEIEFSGMNLDVFGRVDGAESGGRMGGIGHAKLATVGERGHARVIFRALEIRHWYGTEQIANETVELGIGDEVRRPLMAERAAKDARESDQCLAAACQAIGPGIGADHLALHAECGGLQGDKVNVLESRNISSVAEHDCRALASSKWWR